MQVVIRRTLFIGAIAALTCGCQPMRPAAVASGAPSFDRQIVDAALASMVSNNAVTGASALVYVDGQELYYGDVGLADAEAGRRWGRDTLVPIFSMTKPITGVTLMSLYEEGLFQLDDPITKYLPEFRRLRVAEVTHDDAVALVAPRRPIKVIDLFRYTACFGYGWEDHPASGYMNRADVLNPTKPLAQLSNELADVPLYCHPGEAWKYGVAVDVQARLAEVVTGRSFESLIFERVLNPLGMTETTYFASAEDQHRLAVAYQPSDDGPMTRVPESETLLHTAQKPVQTNGGHGLISTVDDYIRFAEMMRNHGALDGVRIIKGETVDKMTRDHLPPGIVERDFLPTKGQMGFGFNLAVRIGPPVDDAEPFGVVGEYFWDGAASTLFWVDPQNNVTAVFLTQVFPFDGRTHVAIRKAVYDALGITPKP